MATTKLMTVEELAELADEPGRYDLIRGELIRMSPAGAKHGILAMRIGHKVSDFVEDHLSGEVFAAETGFILHRDPDVLLAPDVAFVRADRLPPDDEQSGFLELAPDLVVEVVSPSDLSRNVHAKVREYLHAGVQLIWVVNPDSRDVTVYLPDRTARILSGDDVLDGGEVLPGFELPLARIFR